MRTGNPKLSALLVLIVVLISTACTASAQSPPTHLKSTYLKFIQSRVTQTLDDLQSNGNWNQATLAVENLFDQAAFYAPDEHPEALRQADLALRMVTQLRHAPQDGRLDLLQFLRASPDLAAYLAYMLQPDESRPLVFALLNRLRKERPTLLEPYATLATAICMVHYKPFEMDINENKARAIDPIDLFDYYVRYENRMFYGIRSVAPELLVYVVDDTGSIPEMTWALSKYQGNRDVGKLFFDIQYDENSFQLGTPKQLTVHGFSLPNILQYGGVCADQAYFATQVGKSIGIPTAYTFGQSSEAAHAWVGFIQSARNGIGWNFDSGRYDEYRGVRGTLMDPTTRDYIPDTYLSLTAEVIGTTPVVRQTAAALADAADRLMTMDDKQLPAPPPPPDITPDTIRPAPRTLGAAAELTLLEAALRQYVGCAPAWFCVRDLAVAGKLTPEQKDRWAGLLSGFGARKYPDFTLAILAPMVSSVSDPLKQDALWGRLFDMFSARFDLAATVRMDEGALWDAQNDPIKADLCYMDVIHRYANAGPFVIDALQAEERVLMKANRPDLVLPLFDQTWRRIQQPQVRSADFLAESNWYRVGQMYADLLKEFGQDARAAQLESQLGSAGISAR